MILKDLLNKHGLDSLLFLDVGAKGEIEYISQLESITNNIGWEPNVIEYEFLKNKYSKSNFKSLKLENSCLSNVEGEIDFQITKHAAMSSILKLDIENYEKHFGQYEEFPKWKDNVSIDKEIKIKSDTLDNYFRDLAGNIDYLKLDTQGTELVILKGAKSLLENKKINVLKIEVATISIYKDQALFSDIDVFMRSYGYILVDFLTYRKEYYNYFNNANKTKSHYAPSGDAIYALDVNYLNIKESLKTGVILKWLGYSSLALKMFKNADLTNSEMNLITHYSFVSYKTKFKKLFKGLLPPIVYNFITNR